MNSIFFLGCKATYSGLVSILHCRRRLEELRIRDPQHVTRHSLKFLSCLTRLRTLKLYWHGRMLINNPWSFDYCLDRQEQRVDNLFNRGSLELLEDIDLSGFYQV